ncbi:MAG: hypothetical protein Q6358_01525 [Candidatus Brocadiales bacterium]|nr:hypothetical protein [Candidatus Brocadiales bacterium]
MNEEITPQYSDIIFYSSPEGNIHVEVIFSDETFWLSQKRMAELFGVEVYTVNYHLKEILQKQVSNPPLRLMNNGWDSKICNLSAFGKFDGWVLLDNFFSMTTGCYFNKRHM